MEKKNVVIYVAGQRFSISTADSQEYVIGIGEKVDVMIKGIAKDNPRLNRDACAILAALDLCDDESKLRQMMEVLRAQVKDYLEANEKLREENESLRAQLKEARESLPESTKETTETEDDKTTTHTPPSPVPSVAESLVMAEATVTTARQTAFTGKKNKKHKKHNNHQTSQAVTTAPTAVTATAIADTSDEESSSPYHQFSIFDDLE